MNPPGGMQGTERDRFSRKLAFYRPSRRLTTKTIYPLFDL